MSFLPQGIIPAVWTPTDADGKLLKRALRENMEAMTAAGADSLLVLGSTGQFIHLNLDERKYVLEMALDFADETPVVVNISHINPDSVVELGWHARDYGAAAVSLLAPWFYPLSEEDLVAFFVKTGKKIELPLILYNFQAMTGKKLTPEIVRAIASQIPLAGVKHSAGDMQEHKGLAEVGREFNFNVVTGWDTHLPEAMALGAKGCVAGLANVVPELLVKIYGLLANGRADEVREPAQQMRRIGEIVNGLEFPLNVAAAMEARGRDPGAPKSIMSAGTRTRYEALREKMRALLRELGLT